jgi:anti-repressor protein
MENNNIQVFNNDRFGEVRSVVKDGEPWFVAVDVCKALEIKNNRDALGRLDDDEKGVVSTDTLGGEQEVGVVNESGLYTLVLGSRKPEAKAFKRWITHDVIPAIRKTGGYIQGEESMSDDDLIARALVMAQKKIELREQQLREKDAQLELQKPKVDFADHVTDSDNAIDMGTFAKYAQKQGITMGRNTLFKWLRDRGVLMDNNVPYQRYLNAGWFRVIENIYNTGSGQYTTPKTLVTGKGQVALINYIRKNCKEAC